MRHIWTYLAVVAFASLATVSIAISRSNEPTPIASQHTTTCIAVPSIYVPVKEL